MTQKQHSILGSLRLSTRRVLLLGLVLVGAISGVPVDQAGAAVWQSFRTGYFTGAYDNSSYGGNAFVLSDGIPGYVNSVDALIGHIQARYGGDYRNMTGASYLVHSMLGHGQPKGDRGVSAAEWADFASRLRALDGPNGSISWNEWGSSIYDTGMNRSTDVYRVPYGATGSFITLRNSAGAVVYKIHRECANPDGAYTGLPEASWKVTPSISVNRTTVRPGEVITWTHTVRNDGPAATRSTVNYHFQNSNGLGAGTGPNSSMGSGTGAGGTSSSTSTYTAQASDADKTLCRATSASPQSSSSNGTITSGAACVTVVNQWAIVPSSTVMSISGTASTTTAKPGDSITWKHEVRNSGPDATRSDVVFRYDGATGFAAAVPATGPAQTLPVNTANGGVRSVTSTHVVTQADVDRTLCRATSATPRSWNNATKLTSAADCVFVPYNYTLTPTLMLDKSGTIEAPTSVNITPRVTNTGPTNSRATQWRLTRIDITSTNSISNPAGGQSAAATLPCAYFAGPGATCVNPPVMQGNSVFNVNVNTLAAAAQSITELPVGSKICFALSVQAVSSSSTNWSHSAPACLVVGKKPKVQIWGGDLVVGKGVASGSDVATSVSVPGDMYGSWGEYGVVASGSVTGMASASGYAGGIPSNTLCSVSLLTVTNRDGAACAVNKIGNYAISGTQPQIATRFPVTATTPKITGSVKVSSLMDLATPGGKVYTNNGNGAITLTADTAAPNASTTIPNGKWIVINAGSNADVIIDRNIIYAAGPFASMASIPQVIIIAKNIIISDAVTQVDAWLVATGKGAEGKLNTCGAGGVTATTLPNATQCASPLRVNGPVIVNHLLLRRTAGSGTGAGRGTPGEVFNLRADAYLWATSYSNGQGRATTVSNKELPPRF